MRDLRYTLRLLLKSPGFTLVALLTLALGIGANTAIFTLVNSVLLRPLPYPNPSRLVAIDQVYKNNQGREAFRAWSYPRFEDLRRVSNSYESLAAFSTVNVNLTGTQNPERLNSESVSAAYFRVLGVDAELGRTFLEEEDRTPGANPVVLISHGLWQRRFGSDHALIGQTIHLNGTPFTVAGVMPAGFRGMASTTDVWTPMMMAPTIFDMPKRLTNPRSYWHQVIGRLRPGISLQQAAAAARALDPEIEKAHPAPGLMRAETQVSSLVEAKIDPAIRRSLFVLFGAVGFVLLIACANLANLLLGRSVARQREAAIRAALGASRGMLIRQFLTESLILSVLGGLCGLLVAAWGVDLATSLQPGVGRGFWTTYARAVDREAAHLDMWVIAFNLGASILTGLLFGLIPALQASRVNVSSRLHNTFRRVNPRSALIVAEVALALVLLAGAGLMIGSFTNLLHTPLGFSADHIATFQINLPRRYSPNLTTQFYQELLAKISANSQVSAATMASSLPVSGQTEGTVLGIEHQEPTQGISVHVVAPEYFSALRIPIRQGRLFTADRAGSPHVIIINETAAKRLLPGENPIGKRVTMVGGWGQPGEPAEIIGIAGDVKYEEIEKRVELDVYASYLQQYPIGAAYVAVRTSGDPSAVYAAVRRAIAELDPDLPLSDAVSMEARFNTAMSRMRFSASLLGVFAVLAAFLAGIGIYGVVSYSVSARTREIGIRMALGARTSVVLGGVVMDALILSALGVALGVPLALASTRALSTMLYGVKPGDPVTLAAISTMLVLIALAASFIPARRAAKIDPIEALRHE